MKCTVHKLEVMGLNISKFELEVCGTSVSVMFEPEISLPVHQSI